MKMDIFDCRFIYLDKDHAFKSCSESTPFWKAEYYAGTHYISGVAKEYKSLNGEWVQFESTLEILIPVNNIKFATK